MKNPEHKTIASLSDLHTEMQLVQKRVNRHEEEFSKKWKQVPGEALKSVLGAILPLFIGGQLSAGAFKLAKGLFELVKGKNGEDGKENKWKEDLSGGAAKLGIFTGLKLLLNLWKGR